MQETPDWVTTSAYPPAVTWMYAYREEGSHAAGEDLAATLVVLGRREEVLLVHGVRGHRGAAGEGLRRADGGGHGAQRLGRLGALHLDQQLGA